MIPMSVGVVGGGVVGHATAKSYVEHVKEVKVYDVLPERRTHAIEEVLACDVVFVCLPTIQIPKKMGCNTSVLNRFFEDHRPQLIDQNNQIVIRSTVPIGFTHATAEYAKLHGRVSHSPEFLTARCAVTDAHLPSRNIVGVTHSLVEVQNHPLVQLYKRRFPSVPLQVMFSDCSEAVKLFLNGFFAVKVAYFNEVRSLCDKLEIDWDAVMMGVLSDGRIHPSHTMVPGPDGKFGFGGACLPKDLANLITCLETADLLAPVSRAAYHRNEMDREKNV